MGFPDYKSNLYVKYDDHNINVKTKINYDFLFLNMQITKGMLH